MFIFVNRATLSFISHHTIIAYMIKLKTMPSQEPVNYIRDVYGQAYDS